MKTRTLKAVVGGGVAVAGLLFLSGLLAGEEFQARLLGQSAHYSSQAEKFIISIDAYSTPEEVFGLAEVLSQKGYEPFMETFRGIVKGFFRPVGGRGVKIPIHVAHSLPTEKGRKIVLFTQRQAWDTEVQQKTDPRFTFMAIELNVDTKGKGDGRIYEQARIRITTQGMMELESYNSAPLQLWGVSQRKS